MQVIELPLKHPELFESLGISQPKASVRALQTGRQSAFSKAHSSPALPSPTGARCEAGSSVLHMQYLQAHRVFDVACMGVCRVCCCTGHPAQARRCWRVLSRTTPTAPLSVCRGRSWCRNTLGRALAWCESCSSWPGKCGRKGREGLARGAFGAWRYTCCSKSGLKGLTENW